MPGRAGPVTDTKKGLKFDHGKPDLSLLYPLQPALFELAKVFEYGILKGYPRGNWMLPFDDGRERLTAAGGRHLFHGYVDGPLAIDQEAMEKYNVKVYSLAQAAWNCLVQLQHELTTADLSTLTDVGNTNTCVDKENCSCRQMGCDEVVK